jgi:hypothetical protein
MSYATGLVAADLPRKTILSSQFFCAPLLSTFEFSNTIGSRFQARCKIRFELQLAVTNPWVVMLLSYFDIGMAQKN